MQTEARQTTQMFPEWMDLRTVVKYVCVSERTVRDWIHRDFNALPAVQAEKKILIRRSQLDRWLESHAVQSSGAGDIDGIVNDVMASLAGAS
jgi:excisionase family DNA binding protein